MNPPVEFALGLRSRLPYLAAAAIVVVLDRLTKVAIQQNLPVGDTHAVLPGFFQLVHFHNTGVAFGLFSGAASEYRTALLLAIGVLAAVVVVVYGWIHSPQARFLQTGLALVLGGALGNLIDRAIYGHVVDFLYFNVGEYYWPAFNVADSAITVGVACLAIELIRDEVRSRS